MNSANSCFNFELNARRKESGAFKQTGQHGVGSIFQETAQTFGNSRISLCERGLPCSRR